jgi:hypothetical protein
MLNVLISKGKLKLFLCCIKQSHHADILVSGGIALLFIILPHYMELRDQSHAQDVSPWQKAQSTHWVKCTGGIKHSMNTVLKRKVPPAQ